MLPRLELDIASLAQQIKTWGLALGFQQIGITKASLNEQTKAHFAEWLQRGYHGKMAYMAAYGMDRTDPTAIIPETLSVIVGRMDYLPPHPRFKQILRDSNQAAISAYAQNRDYHKLLRQRLQKLAEKINAVIVPFKYRVFVDSGPIMEKPLAQQAGLGWIGKNTLLLNSKAGSYFFLGTLLTNLPLPQDEAFSKMHCGSCSACIKICPTGAIIAPHVLDARRCISYLTIELKEAIPVEFRQAIGNRIFGCDDCQIVCPWNKFAKASTELAFHASRGLIVPDLVSLFSWSQSEFQDKTLGSPLKRIGYERWLRNIAVALGNAPTTPAVVAALRSRQDAESALVREHVAWALTQHEV